MDQFLTRLLFITTICILCIPAFATQDNEGYYNQLINKTSKEIFTNPEMTLEDYKKGIETFKNADTLKTIRILAEMADLYAQIADYSNSYDGYWEALILAELNGNEDAKATVYSGLGWLYSFYQRKEIAIKYFNMALSIHKNKYGDNPEESQLIRETYYALATVHRKDNELEQAEAYLDSCDQMINKTLGHEASRPFISAERGYVLYKKKKLELALQNLIEAKSFFESSDSSYLIILYPFIADIYKDTNKLDSSEIYYKKAIQISEIYKSHLDLIPDVYAKLSVLYSLQGQYKLAYEYMETSIKLNEIQFGSRSKNNQGLLEIKDDFRIEMERQNELIQQQKLATLEQVNKNRNLQTLILLISLVSFIFIGILIFRNLRARHKAEKRLLNRQKEMEKQKSLEIIEAKNKELTSSALHVIEKEEILAETKNELLKQRDNPNPSEINKVIRRINLSTNQSWKEFELRFLQVNKDFYRRLKEKHGQLSQNDHKTCALIKLNFSSKDMSTLLGISIESVHTTRYRLRKKMGLDRNVNLEDYIGNL